MVQQSEMPLKRERGDWNKQKSCNEKSKLMLWKEAMSVCRQFMGIAPVSFHFIFPFFLLLLLSLSLPLPSFAFSRIRFLSLSLFLLPYPGSVSHIVPFHCLSINLVFVELRLLLYFLFPLSVLSPNLVWIAFFDSIAFFVFLFLGLSWIFART